MDDLVQRGIYILADTLGMTLYKGKHNTYHGNVKFSLLKDFNFGMSVTLTSVYPGREYVVGVFKMGGNLTLIVQARPGSTRSSVRVYVMDDALKEKNYCNYLESMAHCKACVAVYYQDIVGKSKWIKEG